MRHTVRSGGGIDLVQRESPVVPALAPLRMRTQRLWGTRFETPRDVVRWLGALQAQEFALAKWSIAQRTRGLKRGDVEQAFADGVIVRTHVLRPTWHFALGEDIRWLLKATAPGVNTLNAYYNRQHKLDTKLFAKSNEIIMSYSESRDASFVPVERGALGAAIHAYTRFAGVPLTVARTRDK